MSRHEGVSCDSCLKGNFRGKRYKCLICYDYDLCATCYEAGAITTRHTTDHPMQCILTRSDFDLYYGGEAVSVEQPQSFTCPFCGKMGFTETTLQEHVTSEHSDAAFEVVCPVCAALPGGEPNHVTEDFAAHLTLEHRSPRDLDEPSGSRHVRRIPHPGRGMSSGRTRRSQMQFSSSGGLSSLSPSSRESMDPIAELLSQLSGVRRTANLAQSSTTSQLQQLQMQLQLERQQAQAARQQLERLPRRQAQTANTAGGTASSGVAASTTAAGVTGGSSAQSHFAIILEPSPSPSSSVGSQFLLSRCTEPTLSDPEQQALEVERADHSLFVQELVLTTLADQLSINEDWANIGKKLGFSSDEEGPAFASLSQTSSALSPDEASSSLSPNCAPGASCGGTSQPALQQHRHSTHQLQPNLQHGQSSRNSVTSAARKSPSSSSSAIRQGNRNSGGSAPPLSLQAREYAPMGQGAGRGSGGLSQRVPSREGLGSGRNSNRTTAREGGTSPSSTRRKVLRHVDERNKSSEPPPPH